MKSIVGKIKEIIDKIKYDNKEKRDDDIYGTMVDALSCKYDDAYFVGYFHSTDKEGNDDVLMVFLDTNYTANNHPRVNLENYNRHISIALDRPVYYKFNEYQDTLSEEDVCRFNDFMRQCINHEVSDSCVWDVCVRHHIIMFEEDKVFIKWNGIPDYKILNEFNYDVLHFDKKYTVHGNEVE